MAKAKLFKNPIKWLLNKEVDERKEIGVNLTPDDDEEKKALVQRLATQEAQLSRYKIREKQEKELERQKDKEQEAIKDLKEQEIQIQKGRYGETVSIGRFFEEIIKNPKFREKLELTDKDDITVFGTFGDILVTKNRGTFVITDSYGNPMVESKTIDRLFFKPESLDNQLKRGRIALPVDKDFKPYIDIENMDVQEMDFDEENRKYFLRESLKKVREMQVEHLEESREKDDMIESLNLTINGLNKELSDEKRARRVLKNQVETSSTELSNAMGLTMQFNSKIGVMQNQIATLTEMKAYYERKLGVLESINDKILKKMEQYGHHTLYEEVKETIKNDIREYKELLPEQIMIKEPEIPKQPMKAGQILPSEPVK